MPLVPSVMRLYDQQPMQQQQQQQQQGQGSPSLAAQQQSKRSPPPATVGQVQTVVGKLHSSPNAGDRISPPPSSSQQQNPQSQNPQSQSSTQSNPPQPPQPPQHPHTQPNIHAHPRPINRVPPPQFLSSFQSMEDNWQMTEQLMAEFEQAHGGHGLSGSASGGLGLSLGGGLDKGTSGVAYAGGAGSSSLSLNRIQQQPKSATPPLSQQQQGQKELVGGERLRLNSPKELDSIAMRRQGRGGERESPKTRDRSASQPQLSPPTTATSTTVGDQDAHGSPQYHTPLASPAEPHQQAPSYTQYRRDTYQTMPRIATPTALRKFSPEVMSSTMRTTPPMSLNVNMKTRTPERDRSLPVQEEPEDDNRWVNDEGHDGRDSRAGHREEIEEEEEEEEEEEDDETLIEQESEDQRRRGGGGGGGIREEEEEGFTPRSAAVNLPADDIHTVLYGGQSVLQGGGGLRQAGLIGLPKHHHRTGSTDQLGLRGIETEIFESMPKIKDDHPVIGGGGRREDLDEQRHYVQEPTRHPNNHTHHQHHLSTPTSQQQQQQQFSNRSQHQQQQPEQYAGYGRLHPPQIPHPDDLQSFFDDPASAFIQAYLNSPRPMAPIPPTPHSQTAAPSPSPLISSVQPSPAPPVGSPYPYPFTHVRRSHAYANAAAAAAAGSPIAPSSSYDPNHPSVIQEQLALQMQMYAMNNHAPVSESNFSPASTPYPGSGYNPWTFLQASRAFGGRRVGDLPPHSLQSSPSHEPLALPPMMPNSRGRGLKKRERSSNLRNQEKARLKQQKQSLVQQPPPRVESTQPRETTPELSSSGEETSTAGGEGRFEVSEEGNWVNGLVRVGHHDNDGDDEDAGGDWVDEDDEEEDDLLDIEYHPSYVSNIEKRRRRWETRWEALIQAVSPVDWGDSDTDFFFLWSSSKLLIDRQMPLSSLWQRHPTPPKCTR